MATSDQLPPASRGVTSQASQREVGYAHQGAPSGYWYIDDERESTPELRWPYSVGVYDRMRRQDAKVQSVLRAVKSPLLATTWRLDPAGADDEVVLHVSRDLGLPIKGVPDADQVHQQGRRRGRFSWTEHLRNTLLCLDFGHMVFEQKYRLDETDPDRPRLHLVKLGPRFPWSIEKFEVARDGGLIAVRQHPPGYTPGLITATGKGIPLDVSRLVVYSHEREGADWWGHSLLRAAYKHWLIKDRLLIVDAQSADRNGTGIPVIEHDKDMLKDEAGGRSPSQMLADLEDVLEEDQRIAEQMRGGDNGGASLTPGAKARLLGVEGTLPDALKSVMYHDDQIGTAVLAHFLNLGRQTGSWALGSTFQDFFVSSLDGIGGFIADTATAHIVEDLVDLNFGEDAAAPRIVYDDLSGQDERLAYAIKALVDAGVITPDDALQAYLRASYKLPESSGETGDDEA